MNKPTIYFDESNNTGGDLLNKEQKVYVLTSTAIDNEQAKILLSKYFDINKEIHFKKLRQSNSGKIKILDFFDDNFDLIDTNFKTIVFHKEFFACCQLVNAIIEPLFYKSNINFHDQGLNIAYTNMFYFCLKAFCGEKISVELYQSFLNILKEEERTEAIKIYLENIKNAILDCNNLDFAKTVLSMLDQNLIAIKYDLSDMYFRDVDPSYSAFLNMLMIWSKIYTKGFNVAHDESNSVESRIDDINFFTKLPKNNADVGYGKLKFIFPIAVDSIDFVKSEKNYSVQLCDLIASALAFTQNLASEKNEFFQEELNKILKNHTLQNLVWPSEEIQLMKERKILQGQLDPIDYLAQQYYKLRNKI